MEAALDEEPFFDFGDDALFPYSRTGLSFIDAESPELLKEQVRKYVPRAPGVYGMLDPLGRLIYVGKSKALRNRLLSYFLPNNEEDKAGRIAQSARSIVWELQPSEFAALVREQYLIRTFQPRFNVQGMPQRQQPVYVCLGRPPAEQLYTARQRDPKATYVLGPLTGYARATRAVEVLNRHFRLRDCSSKQPCSFTDQLQLFDIGLRPGCIRLEIESCLGPCISACSRKEYEQEVDAALEFLKGACNAPLLALESQMRLAAERRHYEQAAVLQDDMRAVGWLHGRSTDLANARAAYTFIFPVPNQCSHLKGKGIWYLIRRGMIEGALAEPSTPSQREAAKQTIRRWLELDGSVGSEFSPRPETLALVASWFKKHRQLLATTFLPGDSTSSKLRKSSAKPARPGRKGQNLNALKTTP